MPLLVALGLSLGSFFGYVAVDKNIPQNAGHYLTKPVKHHNKPLFQIGGH